MTRRPWSIVIISVIYLIIPIFNVFVSFKSLKIPVLTYLQSLSSPAQVMPLFNMVIPSLIVSFAIFKVKNWSYPVFLVAMGWIATRTIFGHLPTYSLHMVLIYIILPISINILFVSYFLLPAVRTAYYDPRQRWWESKPRYIYSTEVELNCGDLLKTFTVTNVSEGGVFVQTEEEIPLDKELSIKLNLLGSEIMTTAKVCYHRSDDVLGYGIKFNNQNRSFIQIIKKKMKLLKKDGCEVTMPVPVWTEDLKKWFVDLITKRKGFTPKVYNHK